MVMKTMTRWFRPYPLLVACLGGLGLLCTPWSLPAEPAAGASTSGTVEQTLLEEIGGGGSVAIVPSAEGLLAISAAGQRKRTLIAGAIAWAMVDGRGQVIWFGRDTSIEIVDLLAPEPRAELLARQAENHPIEICYGASTCLGLLCTEYDQHLVLNLRSKRADARIEPALYGAIFDENGKDARRLKKKFAWAEGGAARAQALAVRGQGRSLPSKIPDKTSQVRGVPQDACESADMCGNAEPVGATRYKAVIVGHQCGDACHVQKQLYDPKTREFIDAANPRRRSRKPLPDEKVETIDDAWIAPGGEGFVSNGRLFSFERGLVFDGGVVSGGGWLGKQSYVQ
jgi:hypothetical protein